MDRCCPGRKVARFDAPSISRKRDGGSVRKKRSEIAADQEIKRGEHQDHERKRRHVFTAEQKFAAPIRHVVREFRFHTLMMYRLMGTRQAGAD